MYLLGPIELELLLQPKLFILQLPLLARRTLHQLVRTTSRLDGLLQTQVLLLLGSFQLVGAHHKSTIVTTTRITRELSRHNVGRRHLKLLDLLACLELQLQDAIFLRALFLESLELLSSPRRVLLQTLHRRLATLALHLQRCPAAATQTPDTHTSAQNAYRRVL
jgi:hypothetical protein